MGQLLLLPSTNGKLVFGLEWLPLIGRRTESRAYQAARQYRSTHLVIDGPDGAAVGLASLDGGDARGNQVLHSAARALANLHASGTVALCLRVAPDTFWVVGAHEGTVIAGTDRLYPTCEQAETGLNGLRQAFPHMRVLDMDARSQGMLPDSMQAACDASTVLRKVRGRHRRVRAGIMGVVLVLLLWALVPGLWNMAFADDTSASVVEPRIDPVAAWGAATARAKRGHIVHGVSGTQQVLGEFYDLPVVVAGWLLISAECLAKSEIWRCQASYQRSVPAANNASFLHAARKPWNVAFPSLDHARPSWTFPSGAQRLDQFSPDNVHYNDRHLVSRLQSISSAFSRLQLGQPVAYPVPPPVDAKGVGIPKPASQANHLTRSVHIKGPLRSASLLLPYVGSIEWTKIRLDIGPAHLPGLASSQLIVSFEGVLHETESQANDCLPCPGGLSCGVAANGDVGRNQRYRSC